MIVTEEEAKTKRCQESFSNAFVSPEGNFLMGVAVNMAAVQSSPSYCIGSACMAWHEVTATRYSSAVERPEGEGWHEVVHNGDTCWTRTIKAGYCGKAP